MLKTRRRIQHMTCSSVIAEIRSQKMFKHLKKKRGRALTVWDALILDFQVFVCSRAGIREDVRPSHDCTLGTVVASARGKEADLLVEEQTHAQKHQLKDDANLCL